MLPEVAGKILNKGTAGAQSDSASLTLASWLAWDPASHAEQDEAPPPPPTPAPKSLYTGKRRGEGRCSAFLDTLPSICNLAFTKQNNAKMQNSHRRGA